jgi:hypothetical protein
MSTTPVTNNGHYAAIPADNPGPTLGAESRNYHKTGLPVLSFTYALYCDMEFGLANYRLWRAAKDEGRDFRGYLKPYRWDQLRHFPAGAIKLIAEDVPEEGPQDPTTSRYSPTNDQAWEMTSFLIPEITGAPDVLAPGEQPPLEPPVHRPSHRLPAELNSDRPLISCLGVIFLNDDNGFRLHPERFLANFEITDNARAILTKFGKGGAKFLSPGQALALCPDLVGELVKAPPTW